MTQKYFLSAFIAILILSYNVFADDCPNGVVICGTTDDGLSWAISNILDENNLPVVLSNGETAQQLTISGTGDMKEYSRTGENIAPWKNPAHTGGNANSAPTITKIVIEDGVTSVGGYAFEDMRSVTSVLLPEGIT